MLRARGGAGGNPAGTGLSRDQFCAADGRDFPRVTAAADAGRVEVRWDETYFANASDPYRVYRREEPSASWRALADIPAAAFLEEAPSRWLDQGSSGEAEYAVTVLSRTCGELPLCSYDPCATVSVGAATPAPTAEET